MKRYLEIEENEGFSLIELVIVISVLAILSAISIPAFSCFINKAKATAALTALRQINTECKISELDNKNIFTVNNLNGYEIRGDNCDGSSSTGIISAVPGESDLLPTFNLWTGSSQITYNYKGKTGSNISDCLSEVCNPNINNENISKDNNKDKDNPTGCNYVAPSNNDRISLNRAKWMLAMCEESRQNVQICQHPYVYANPSDSPSNYGPPFPMVPCSSLCDEFKNSSGFQKGFCGENAFKKPDWIEDQSADNWSISAHGEGENNGESLLETFKSSGWYSYD